MRILYTANTGAVANDDEGSITYALERLGHTVVRVPERGRFREKAKECDFVLFHHTNNFHELQNIRDTPKVFWYFDLIDWTRDETVKRRSEQRIRRMYKVTRISDLGFCTDGDWVKQDSSGKLVRLTQGADERIMSYPNNRESRIGILFTGNYKGGRARTSWYQAICKTYRTKFATRTRDYREKLRDLIHQTCIVIAPDAPITDHYWSNRVYVALGFGAFMIHPYSKTLAAQYEEGEEIIFYRNRVEMNHHIHYYLKHADSREEIALAGYMRTIKEHTYYHRCRTLIETVQERLFK